MKDWIDVEKKQPEIFQEVAFIVESNDPIYHHKRMGGRYQGKKEWGHEFSTPGIGWKGVFWFPFPELPKVLLSVFFLFFAICSFGQGFTLGAGQSISTKVYLDSGIHATGYFGQLTQEVYRDTTLFDQTDGYVHGDKVVHYPVSKKGVKKDKHGETVDTSFVYDHRLFLRQQASDSANKYMLLFNKAWHKDEFIKMYRYNAKFEYYNGRWDAISECIYYGFPKEFSHKK